MVTESNLIGSRLRKAAAQVPYLLRTLRLIWDASPRLTLAWFTLLAVQGVLPAATVVLTRALVNSLVLVIDSGGTWETLQPTLLVAALMAAVLLASELLRGAATWVRTAQAELVQDRISALVHTQSIAVDLAFYDQPDYFDHLYRARSEASYRPVSLLENIGGLFQNGVTLVAIAVVLVPYGAWLPVVLLLSTLPALYTALHFRAREHRWRLRTTADERRTWYYDWLLTARETAAEQRLFALGGRFQTAFQTLRQRLRSERLQLTRDEGLARLLASASALLVTFATMAYMIWQATLGRFNLGDLAFFYAAFNQGQGLMRSLLENLGEMYSNSLFLGDLFEFLALEPQVVTPAAPVPLPLLAPNHEEAAVGATQDTLRAPALHFEGVTFRYPGQAAERTILDRLDLAVAPGQLAAIVGPNGTGKTTLIKLLCRFYDPLAGRITLDGVDLRDLALDDLRRAITILFQEPVQYNASAAENIAVGNGRVDLATIQAAAQAAGADGPITRLPQGYDTLLGTWFAGGTDLSVGEWQRIALARAFLRQAPIVVLDEPTSAMDSWAEADWLARLRGLVAGRTALIITHRFTTARYADVIHVLDEGRIVESGTHERLLALGGRYAQSWQAQTVGGVGGPVMKND